jgi:hypothetical protein
LSDQQDQSPVAPPEAPPKPKAEPKAKVITAHFQQNRSFELYLGGVLHSYWLPFESKALTADEVSHPDFLAYKNQGFFSVTEV